MNQEDLEQIDALIARRLAASAPPTERYIEGRRVRPHATVQDGMVYALPQRSAWLNRIMAVATIALLLYAGYLIFLPSLAGAPTARIAPTSAPAFHTNSAPRSQPPQERPTAPAVEQSIAAYNDAQHATATAIYAVEPTVEPPTPAPAWHAPMAPTYDVCAAWHAPLPWPAECGEQQGWHAPLVRP